MRRKVSRNGPAQSWRSQNNTVVNERANPLFLVNAGGETASITNNKFFGLTAAQIASGANAQSGDVFLSVKPFIASSHPWVASSGTGEKHGAVSVLDPRDLFGSHAPSNPGEPTFGNFEHPGLNSTAPIIDTDVSLAITDVPQVPEPPALWLFALGLGLVIWLAWGKTGNRTDGSFSNELNQPQGHAVFAAILTWPVL